MLILFHFLSKCRNLNRRTIYLFIVWNWFGKKNKRKIIRNEKTQFPQELRNDFELYLYFIEMLFSYFHLKTWRNIFILLIFTRSHLIWVFHFISLPPYIFIYFSFTYKALFITAKSDEKTGIIHIFSATNICNSFVQHFHFDLSRAL